MLSIEGLVADIYSVASDILKTGRPLFQYYKEQSNYVQIDALRLRYNPLITEHSDQARQRLTDRFYFLNEVPERRKLVKLRFIEYDLLSFISEAEKALCSNDDPFLACLIGNVNSVADEIVSLARPLAQIYEHKSKFKQADDLKRKFDHLTVDRVNRV